MSMLVINDIRKARRPTNVAMEDAALSGLIEILDITNQP